MRGLRNPSNRPGGPPAFKGQSLYAPAITPVEYSQIGAARITDAALRARVGGSVKLRVLVGADGKAVRVYVTRRLGYGLDRRAVETALQYQYDPELEGGLPQTTWTDMEVKFGQ